MSPVSRSPIRPLIVLAAVAAAALVVDGASAATVPVAAIPSTSATAAGFAPPGWRVEKRITANLDGVPPADLVVGLTQASGGIYAGGDGSRALVLALGRTGGFRRAGVAPRLLGCSVCGGTFWGTRPMPVTLRVAGRVLTVRQQFGSNVVTATTHRIAWNAAAGGFRLIGLDSSVTDRRTDLTTATSTNHLTRRQTTVRRRGSTVLSSRRRTVAVQPRRLAGLTFGTTRP